MRSIVWMLLLVAAPAWAAKPKWLTCDPEAMNYKPMISVGEDQAPPVPVAKKEGQSETFFLSNESPALTHHVQEAGEGKIFLGLQSLYLNESNQKRRKIKLEKWAKSRIFGLDHPLPGGLAALVRAFAEVKAAPPDRPAKASKPVDPAEAEASPKQDTKILHAKAAFLRALADNSYLRESWRTARKIRGTIPNAREETVAKIFDQVVDDASLDHEKLLGELAKDHPWHDRLPFLDLIAGVERGYVTVLKKYGATSRYQMSSSIPPMMEKYFRLEGELSSVAEALEAAVAKWRVLFVASSVSALLCKASEESKNIVALVEADEMDELKKLLKESLGKAIKVVDVAALDEEEEEAPAAKPATKPSAAPKGAT